MARRRKRGNRENRAGGIQTSGNRRTLQKAGKRRKGNGKQLSSILYRRNTIPLNTWKQAPMTKADDVKSKNSASPQEISAQAQQ